MRFDTVIEEEELNSSVSNRLMAVKSKISKLKRESQRKSGIVTSSFVGTSLDSSSGEYENDPHASFHLAMELFGQEDSVMERTIQEKLQQVENELDDIVDSMEQEESDKSKAAASPDQTLRSPQELDVESAALKNKIQILRDCSEVRALLDESVQFSLATEPNLVESVKLLLRATAVLERVSTTAKTSNADPALENILSATSDSLRRQNTYLTDRAKSLFQVELIDSSLVVGAPSSFEKAYETLETLQSEHKYDNSKSVMLDVLLRKLCRDLHETIFQKALQSHATDISAVKPWKFDEIRESNKRMRLEWCIMDKDINKNTATTELLQEQVECWKHTIDILQRMLSFVVDHVLLRRPSLVSFVGRRLFAKPDAQPSELNVDDILGLESRRLGDDHGLILEPLTDMLSATCVPKSLNPSELDHTLWATSQQLEEILTPFADFLVQEGLISKDGYAYSKLLSFVNSLEQMYVDGRHCFVLSRSRQILLQTDYHNTVPIGSQDAISQYRDLEEGLAVFQLPKCSISVTAYELMKLCRETMDEAVAVTQQRAKVLHPDQATTNALSSLPLVLYQSARSVLDLFRSIIPLRSGYEIQNVPRTAAVFHNDCAFFAHHCLTLGLEYKDMFPTTPEQPEISLLRRTCTFVDMVPLFRDLAEKSFGNMLDKQAKEMVEIVGSRIPLFGEALQSDELLVEWSDAETALSAGVFHLRNLFQAWKPVLSQDIFVRSLWYLADVMLTLFLEQITTKARDISVTACPFVSNLFRSAGEDILELVGGDTSSSRVFDRFSAIGRFVDMSLADIEVALTDGVFQSVSGPELSNLITAIFEDSSKRNNILTLLDKHKESRSATNKV